MVKIRRYGVFPRRQVRADAKGLYIYFCGLTHLRAPKHTKMKEGMMVSVINVRNMNGGAVKVFTNISTWEQWGEF